MLLPPLCKFDIWRILKLNAPDHSFSAQIILESIRYEVGPDDPIGYTKQYSKLNYLEINASDHGITAQNNSLLQKR